MYTTKDLLADVQAQLKKSSSPAFKQTHVDIGEVWKAINNYVASCFEKRRGIELPRLCKIGWQLARVEPDHAYEPYFLLAPLFAHGKGGPDVVNGSAKDVKTQSRHVLPFEAFCCSKAALRFSKTQTKKHVFIGLKSIVDRLADVVAQGREVVVDFDVGKLLAKDRAVTFAFAPQFYESKAYESHGVKAPAASEAAKDMEYKRPSIVQSSYDVYTNQHLMEDLQRQRKMLLTGFPSDIAPELDFPEIWAVVNKYAFQALGAKRGVVLPNFFRIGWELPKDGFAAHPEHTPYFALLEPFCQAHGIQSQAGAKPRFPATHLEPMEELNFQKAALMIAKNVSRQTFLTGYKHLVAAIGAAIAQNQHVSLEFSFGRLQVASVTSTFTFSKQIFDALGKGKDLPPQIADDSMGKTAGSETAKQDVVLQGSLLGGPGTDATEQPEHTGWTPASTPRLTPRGTASRPISRGSTGRPISRGSMRRPITGLTTSRPVTPQGATSRPLTPRGTTGRPLSVAGVSSFKATPWLGATSQLEGDRLQSD
eukprot:TRINITY_DN27894_c0_g1_i1.p1 TRINITY_DN27894_c0_g1~~TRINITY_DN27894_c0_g1_i1.p1  ORF type:complete len:556 (+),score=96.39 TRINITY_DN27894_c0_g1_i1:61-1668(+)